MKRDVKVGVLSIPLKEVGDSGTRPVASTFFSFNETNELQGIVIGFLDDKKSELESIYGRKISIRDLGEFPHGFDGLKEGFEGSKNIAIIRLNAGVSIEEADRRYKIIFNQMAQDAVRLAKEYDIIICVGMSHGGALPFYKIDGKVVRVDQHGDSHKLEIQSKFRRHVNCFNYVGEAVIRDDIKKKPGDILNWGLAPQKGFDSLMVTVGEKIDNWEQAKGVFFDIDLDGLHEKHNIGVPPNLKPTKLGVVIEDLKKAILASKPSVVGFFEYSKRYANEETIEFIKDTSYTAVEAVLKP